MTFSLSIASLTPDSKRFHILLEEFGTMTDISYTFSIVGERKANIVDIITIERMTTVIMNGLFFFIDITPSQNMFHLPELSGFLLYKELLEYEL